jgi:Lar family restriction alleviation protein
MTTENKEALKPCPFCGGEAEIIYRSNPMSKWKYTAECKSTICGASGSVGENKSVAINNWNTRTDAAKAFQSVSLETGSPSTPEPVGESFQNQVNAWMMQCFGIEISADKIERNHRFLEEALELVQSLGCTASEAHQLVDYVFGREIGEPHQELGGVMVTLAALSNANNMSMKSNGDIELARVWTMVEKIRAKQAAKPKHSPLPAALSAPVSQTGEKGDESARKNAIADFIGLWRAMDDGDSDYKWNEPRFASYAVELAEKHFKNQAPVSLPSEEEIRKSVGSELQHYAITPFVLDSMVNTITRAILALFQSKHKGV